VEKMVERASSNRKGKRSSKFSIEF